MLKSFLGKQNKTQISLVALLGLTVVGQIGFGLYRTSCPVAAPEPLQTQTAHAGSAKAFGLVSPQEKHLKVSSVKELSQAFKSCDYTLAKVKNGGTVPRLYVQALPKDMKNKKASNHEFIQVLLPHILKVNEMILQDRNRLLEMQARLKEGGHLRHSEKMWLTKLASDHRCKSTKIEALLVHVDVVPASLALAQGIIETGGGTSHAALAKNSTFGHMATKTKVQKFESLYHSVVAYITNLNRHQAYAGFRKERAMQRKNNQAPNGHKLAPQLVKYSVRGTAYTKDLQRLITKFGLAGYDHMTLDQHMRLKP
jgi:Bax protein